MERVAFRPSFVISDARVESLVLSVMSVAATLLSANIVMTLLRESYAAGSIHISKYFNYIAYRESLNPAEWWHWFRKNPESSIGSGKKVFGGNAMGRRVLLAILLKIVVICAQIGVNLLVSYRDGQVYLQDIGAIAVFGNVSVYSIDTGDCLLDVPRGGRATISGVTGVCVEGTESNAPPETMKMERTNTGLLFSFGSTGTVENLIRLKAVLYANTKYGIILKNSISQEGVNQLRSALQDGAGCGVVGDDIAEVSLTECERPVSKRSLLEVGRTISVTPDLGTDIVIAPDSDELLQAENVIIGTYPTTLVWYGTLFAVVGFLLLVSLFVAIVTRGNVQRVINNMLIEAAGCVSSANYAEIESGRVEIVLSTSKNAEEGHVGVRIPDGFVNGDPDGYRVV